MVLSGLRGTSILAVLLVVTGSTAALDAVVGSASAQPARTWSQESASLRAAASGGGARTAGVRQPAAEHYDVIALRVSFQPDTTRFSTGDGTFEGPLYAEGLVPKMDPLPHDADYFRARLAFLEHYVATVSDGKTRVTTHLLPEVRVSGKMGSYAPTGPQSQSPGQLAKLARLVGEAWTLADRAFAFDASGLDPARTAFLIFHAGVGRDIELTGTSLDKTPEDLPSLFFGAEALAMHGVSATFRGMLVNNGLIVPRTETRQGFNFIIDAPFLAEFSTNGLLAATFFNYLGVPDLFNTESGQSAIGPFGLMDGQGIFAFYGLFPPEPSGWTKRFLGWDDPVPVQEGPVTLRHVGDAARSDQAVIPVGSALAGDPAEYFLVENRHRDPQGDGVVLQVWRGGRVVEERFPNGAETFNANTVSGFGGGVVVAVDDYDFALPGGLDEDGGELLGGMLVWHVDERVIAAGLASNRVNADPLHRGVDVEEADGAQDIGYPSGGFFGPQFELGSPFDFWYEGNPVSVLTAAGREIRLYRNRFGPDTYPNSDAADGGRSFVELSDFSVPGSVMSVTVRRTAMSGIAPDAARTAGLPVAADAFAAGGALKAVGDGVAAFGVNRSGRGTLGFVSSAGVHVLADLEAAEPLLAGADLVALGRDGFLQVGADGRASLMAPVDPKVVDHASTPLVRIGTGYAVGVRGASGWGILSLQGGQVRFESSGEPILGLGADGNRLVVVTPTQVHAQSSDVRWTIPAIEGLPRLRTTVGSDRGGLFGAVPDPAGGRLHLLQPDGSVVSLSSSTGHALDGLGAETTLADLDGDGLLDALVVAGDRLLAFSRSGAVVPGFPVRMRSGTKVGQPIVTGEPQAVRPVIVVASSDGFVEAYDLAAGGSPVPGFPLGVGAASSVAPLVSGGSVAGVAANGDLVAWSLEAAWRSAAALVDGSNASYVHLQDVNVDGPGTDDLLVASETYNWPNPVTDGKTWFRLMMTRDGRASIRIVDPAGRLIDELEMEGIRAGVASERPWVTTAPSGLYIARVRAVADDGARQDRLVRIAVIQ